MTLSVSDGEIVFYNDKNGNTVEGIVHLGEYFYKTEWEETRHYGYFVENTNITTTKGIHLSFAKLHHSNGQIPEEWRDVDEKRSVISILDYDVVKKI